MNTLQINLISYEYYGKPGRKEAIVWREYSDNIQDKDACEHGYIPVQIDNSEKYKDKPIEFLKKARELDHLLDDYYEIDNEGNVIIKDLCKIIHVNGGTLFKATYTVDPFKP